MLATLKVKNVALIENLTIQFEKGLNIISGETGSGKSILLSSLGLCFGERADKTMIRTGQDRLRATALFCSVPDGIKKLLDSELGILCEDELVLDRELDNSGKSTSRINGEIVTAGTLKKISSYLVDLHGQHEHQSIINNDYQLQILDDYGGDDIFKIITELNKLIDAVNDNEKILKSLGGSQSEKQNLLDLYRHNCEEIKSADIKSDEFETLLERKKVMNASEKVNIILTNINQRLTGVGLGESVLESIRQSQKELGSLSNLSSEFSDLTKRLDSSYFELKDISENVSNMLDKMFFDENEFERTDARLDKMKNLFKKYGGGFDSMTEYYNTAIKKISELENADEMFERILADNAMLLDKINKLQHLLFELRKSAGADLSKKIQLEIRKLGMPSAIVEIKVTKTNIAYSRNGNDSVEFLFSANKGFEPKSLSKIISGGEMSRFMLAYKSVVASIDNIDTLIFDEIDSGISGNTAQMVALNMHELSQSKQVIAITHLPFIAAFADNHLLATKSADNTTTHSDIFKLNFDEQILEIARMIGAGEQNVDAQKLAKNMKNDAESQKKLKT